MSNFVRYQIYVKWDESTGNKDFPWSAKTYTDQLSAEMIVAEMNRFQIGKKNNYHFEIREVHLYQKVT